MSENTTTSPVSANGTNIDSIAIKKASLILRALNHKLRLSIIALLDEATKLTVTEIYVKLRLEQSVASQHLAILRRADILKTTRDGKNIYYAVNHARIAEVQGFVSDLLA